MEQNNTFFAVPITDWDAPLQFEIGSQGRVTINTLNTYPPAIGNLSFDGDDVVGIAGTCLDCYGEPLALVLGTQLFYLRNSSATSVTASFDNSFLKNDLGNLDYGLLWPTGQLVLASGHFFNPGPPIIDRINPPIGSTGTTITLHGKHLLPADTSDPEVSINGVGLAIVNFDETMIEARLGAVSANIVAPVLVAHSGVSGSSAQSFHWVAWGQSPVSVLSGVCSIWNASLLIVNSPGYS